MRSILVSNSVKQVLNSVEQCHEHVLNSVKQCHKPVINQSNGRAKPSGLNKPVWDPEMPLCSSTPRFSYRCPKTAICTCPSGTQHGTAATLGTVQRPGRVLGTGILGGYWEGYTGTGVLPSHTARGGLSSQRSGPGSPQGLEWWGTEAGRTGGAADGPHPPGPVSHPAGAFSGTILRLAPPPDQ